MTADFAPEVMLALIQNRAERLAADLHARRTIPGGVTAAVEGIATDLAGVIAQLPQPVTP